MAKLNLAEKLDRNERAEIITEQNHEENEDGTARKGPLYVVPQACRWVKRGGQWVCI
jgi:hypothetical protein